MNLIVFGLTLLTVGAPPSILLLDLVLKKPAHKTISLLGLPALIVVLAIASYSYMADHVLFEALFWGTLAGIVATAALDSIRIPGYLMGYMPLDLPLRFGTKILNLDNKLMTNMMLKVSDYILDEMGKGVSTTKLMDAKGMPRLRVPEIRKLINPALNELCLTERIPKHKIRFLGYLWHYSNGISFGIAHILFFGQAGWIYTFGFGMLLAIVFLSIIKFLIPILKLDYKLPSVVLLAHVAVVLAIGTITLSYLPPEANAYSLLGILSKSP